MKVSVNILNWNCKDTLEAALEMLKEEMAVLSHEIIVVDNGSTDGSQEMLKRMCMEYPGGTLSYILLEENEGISIGKNVGVQASQGEYLMLLDADIVPVPNSIRLLCQHLDENPECDAIGMHPNKWCTDKNTELVDYHERFCNKLYAPKESKATCLFYGIYRRKIFDKILLDESGEFGKPGYGWEDHDFYMQMKKAGFKQWVAHINNETGRYFHAINSSIKNPGCMGRNKYLDTSRARAKQYHKKWPK